MWLNIAAIISSKT